MQALTQDEHAHAAACVKEFAQSGLRDAVLGFECVYRSHDFPKTRLLLRVTTGSQHYAIKIDTTSAETGRLQKEFQLLQELSAYFEGNQTSRVIQPVYLSQDQRFFASEFIDRPTAVDLIYNSTDADQVAQIFRRAGSWLHDFHGFRAPTQYGFRPRWMTASFQELAASLPHPLAQKSEVLINVMRSEADRLKGQPDLRVFAHGDFHGLNLIVGQGKTIGLDFTEAREKLATYDIVDFLKADIFRDGPASEVDRSGILRRNKEMFFRRYRHPINIDILDFCIRGRLLKDWLFLSRSDHTCSPQEDHRRARLELRLQQAFRQTIG